MKKLFFKRGDGPVATAHFYYRKEKEKMIVGIDPGFEGAICIMNHKKEIIDIFDMPVLTMQKSGKRTGKVLDSCALKDIMSKAKIEHAFIEKAQVMPKQGVVSGFNYGTCYGTIIGICVGLGIPYTLIRPNMWKKAMMPGMTKEKQASIVRILQLYPNLKMKRKKDHNKCDAILLALFGYEYDNSI